MIRLYSLLGISLFFFACSNSSTNSTDSETISEEDMPVNGSMMLKSGEECPNCSGQGNVACSYCQGTGRIHCGDCSGRGYDQDGRACLRCERSGIVNCNEEEQCRVCHGYGNVFIETCTVCDGDGLIENEDGTTTKCGVDLLSGLTELFASAYGESKPIGCKGRGYICIPVDDPKFQEE